MVTPASFQFELQQPGATVWPCTLRWSDTVGLLLGAAVGAAGACTGHLHNWKTMQFANEQGRKLELFETVAA
jgi:hypothetical protein